MDHFTDERRLSYCEMLKQRRAEAERSVIVEFTFGTNLQHLSNKLKSVGGRIKDAFYYKMNSKVVYQYKNTPNVAHVIYRFFLNCKNGQLSVDFFLYFAYFCSKLRLWVQGRTASVLTSNDILCFGAKIRKKGNPYQPHFHCINVGFNRGKL